MSRLQIDLLTTTTSGTGQVDVIEAAAVTVYARNTDGTQGSAATVFQNPNPSNSTALTQPLVSDSNGRIPGWLDPGDYYVSVSATGYNPYSISYTVPSAAGGGGTSIGNWGSDNQTADSRTTVTAGDPTATVAVLMTSPPAWLSSFGVFSGDGIYAVWAEVDVVTVGSATGQHAFIGCPFNLGFPVSLDALHASDIAGLGGFTTPMDVQAFTNADGDLPRTAFVRVTVPSAATGWAIKVRPWVDRLAYT